MLSSVIKDSAAQLMHVGKEKANCEEVTAQLRDKLGFAYATVKELAGASCAPW